MLENFCAARGLRHECIVALAMVLMLISELVEVDLQLPTSTTPAEIALNEDRRDEYFDILYGSIDKCIALSCVREGIDSLLCSVFFDPSVIFNFVGAQ